MSENSGHLLVGGEPPGREQRDAEDQARAVCPVHPVPVPPGTELTVVTVGQEQARTLLADPRLSKDADAIIAELVRQQQQIGIDDAEVSAMFGPTVLFSDDPRHRRLRRPLAATFTPRRVELLRPRVERLAAELIDRLPAGEPVDLVERFAFPLPLTVICELLGVPEHDRGDMRMWTEHLMTGDPRWTLPASRNMRGYFGELLGAKRADPDDGLLSALATANTDGDALTSAELVGMAILLVVAGHETTTNLLGNTIYELLAGNVWQRVAADPDLVDAAVQESLRVDPPVRNATHRIATEDIVIDGSLIPAGSLALINIGAANRCPAIHPERPAEYDLARHGAAQHLAFGHGVHYCLGANLALMESEIALRQLITRYPRARLADETLPRRRSSAIMSGYQSVLVDLGEGNGRPVAGS